MASCGFETVIFHCLLISLNVLKFSYLQELSNLLYAVLYPLLFFLSHLLLFAVAKTYLLTSFGDVVGLSDLAMCMAFSVGIM